jgi:hypothetical protein
MNDRRENARQATGDKEGGPYIRPLPQKTDIWPIRPGGRNILYTVFGKMTSPQNSGKEVFIMDNSGIIQEIEKMLPDSSLKALEFVYYYLLKWGKLKSDNE